MLVFSELHVFVWCRREGQLFWWSTPQPLNPLSGETNRVMSEDAEYRRKETKQVERVENELAETLCETSPLLEPANQRRMNVAGMVRSKSHVNETDGFSDARECEKHANLFVFGRDIWDGSICCDPVRNSSWWQDLQNKKIWNKRMEILPNTSGAGSRTKKSGTPWKCDRGPGGESGTYRIEKERFKCSFT